MAMFESFGGTGTISEYWPSNCVEKWQLNLSADDVDSTVDKSCIGTGERASRGA